MKRAFRFMPMLAILISTTTVAGRPQASDQRNAKVSDAGWQELQTNMQKMHVTMMSVKSSSDTDIDFVKLMLAHHQAAIEMSKTQMLYGKDPQIRRLAQEIITDQQSEIDLMQIWLNHHSPTTSPPLR